MANGNVFGGFLAMKGVKFGADIRRTFEIRKCLNFTLKKHGITEERLHHSSPLPQKCQPIENLTNFRRPFSECLYFPSTSTKILLIVEAGNWKCPKNYTIFFLHVFFVHHTKSCREFESTIRNLT